MVNKKFLGHICTAMMFNELEIIVWCYTLYCLMTIEEVRPWETVKFTNQDELVLAAAIFAKVTSQLFLNLHSLQRTTSRTSTLRG